MIPIEWLIVGLVPWLLLVFFVLSRCWTEEDSEGLAKAIEAAHLGPVTSCVVVLTIVLVGRLIGAGIVIVLIEYVFQPLGEMF